MNEHRCLVQPERRIAAFLGAEDFDDRLQLVIFDIRVIMPCIIERTAHAE